MPTTKEIRDDMIHKFNEKTLAYADDREALDFVASIITRNQLEILDKLTIVHADQVALSNQMVDITKKKEPNIILPH